MSLDMPHRSGCTRGPYCDCDPPEPDPNDPLDDGYDFDAIYERVANAELLANLRPAHVDHRLAAEVGGHPVIPLPVHWRLGLHGDPIAVFDHIVLHLHRDGTVTWSDQIANVEAGGDTDA